MLKKYPLAITAGSLCAVLALAQEAPPADPSAMPTPAVEKKTDAPKPVTHSVAPKPTPKSTAASSGLTPIPDLVATPTPTPKPRKPSFLERLFGSRKRTPAPTPAPVPASTPAQRRVVNHKPAATPTPVPAPDLATTPKPSRTTKPISTPKPTPTPKATPASKLDMPKVAPATTPKPSASETGAKTPSSESTKVAPAEAPAKVAPAATPKPPASTPVKAPAATPAKKAPAITKPAVTEPKKVLVEPSADADPDVKERYHFDVAKAKAAEDPTVKSLKAKADDASTDDESRKALRAYNKALFEKIRKIDSSVSERADRLEAAILKRLSE